jgi:hypothetical protein
MHHAVNSAGTKPVKNAAPLKNDPIWPFFGNKKPFGLPEAKCRKAPAL